MRVSNFTLVVAGSCVLTTAVILSFGCGGGGGGIPPGTPSPVSSLAGGWLGPTGDATAGSNLTGTGGAGMTADLSGAFAGTGAFAGKMGQIAPVSPSVFTFTRSDATTGFLFLSADGDHLAYVDSDQKFGVWQRDTISSTPMAYTTGDTFSSAWDGLLGSFDSMFDSTGANAFNLTIGAAGAIALSNPTNNGVTDMNALSLVDAMNGEFTGDIVDGVDTGRYTMLISPDRAVSALFLCGTGGTFPAACSVGVFQRQP